MIAVLLLSWVGASAGASPSERYIDQLRATMDAKPAETGISYTEKLRSKIEARDREETTEARGYSELLKEGLPAEDETSAGYTEQVRSKLAAPERGSAIQAVAEGKSDLKLRREGAIHHAIAVRIAARSTRDIERDGRRVSDFYGTGWVPDLTASYEFQPFHSEWFGNVGVVFGGGLSFQKAAGSFKFPLTNVGDGSAFAATARTSFQFFAMPAFAGLNYRFNLFRILRPYVQAAPALVFFYETRNDDRGASWAYSRALMLSGGVNILLDWFSQSSTWDLYDERGVKHFYLTLDYTKNTSLGGEIGYAVSGISAGLTYEF